MGNLSGLKDLLKGGLALDDDAFLALRDGEDGMLRAVRFIVTLGLLAGLLPALVGLAEKIGQSPADEVAEVRTGVEEALRTMEDMGLFSAEPEAAETMLDMWRRNFAVSEHVAQTIAATTPAPYAAVRVLESLAAWLSKPFAWLSMWLTWGVLTLIFARMLGGTATIAQMLATSSLVVAPHVLEAFSFVPCGGALLQLLAFFWGLAAYVKGTALANRIGVGRAALAVMGPLLVGGAAAVAAVAVVAVLAAVG